LYIAIYSKLIIPQPHHGQSDPSSKNINAKVILTKALNAIP
jgi:hypothetical protein